MNTKKILFSIAFAHALLVGSVSFGAAEQPEKAPVTQFESSGEMTLDQARAWIDEQIELINKDSEQFTMRDRTPLMHEVKSAFGENTTLPTATIQNMFRCYVAQKYNAENMPLPPEILVEVASNVGSSEDLQNFRLACKYFANLGERPLREKQVQVQEDIAAHPDGVIRVRTITLSEYEFELTYNADQRYYNVIGRDIRNNVELGLNIHPRELTIASLKNMLEHISGIPSIQQGMIHKGKKLDDDNFDLILGSPDEPEYYWVVLRLL